MSWKVLIKNLKLIKKLLKIIMKSLKMKKILQIKIYKMKNSS